MVNELNDNLATVGQQTLNSTLVLAADTDYKAGSNVYEIHVNVYTPTWLPDGYYAYGILRRTDVKDYNLYEIYTFAGKYAFCVLSKTADLTSAGWIVVK